MVRDPYKYFRIEARELLEGLQHGCLALERAPGDPELIARLLRLFHTLKGACRVVRHPEIAEVAHGAEDLLAPHRDGRTEVPQGQIDELLAAIAECRRLIQALIGGGQAGKAAARAAGGEGVPGQDEGRFETVRIDLDEVGELLEDVHELEVQLSGLDQKRAHVDQMRRQARGLLRLLSGRAAPAAALGETALSKARAQAEALTVELARFQQNLAVWQDRAAREFEQVRERAGRLRLVPARSIFGPLELAARDAARDLSRKVELRATGGELRLDGHVLSALRDALLHVVRNAIAHGIEPPAERLAAGKPETGLVTLAVEQRGNRAAFICTDDGRGIDAGAIQAAAVDRGLVDPEADGTVGKERIAELVLRGGLTTASAVDFVSGRGVGMDVVRDTVARLDGEVSLDFEPGRGTRLELVLPVSLVSVAALVVEAGGSVVSIPLDAVVRVVRMSSSEVTRTPEGDTIPHESASVPFVALGKLIGKLDSRSSGGRRWSTLIVRSAGRLAAIGADRLHGTSRVVVRSLPPSVRAHPVVAGASFDAEGNPRLMLEPAGLVSSVSSGTVPAAHHEAHRDPPILVVDDSLTSRMLEQSILESAGYEVAVASSAQEALELARSREFGLFVVDVEMPGMNGFEFIETLRADPLMGKKPAILVTSLSSADDKRRGREVGADAYIVKSSFDQGELLGTIRRLLG